MIQATRPAIPAGNARRGTPRSAPGQQDHAGRRECRGDTGQRLPQPRGSPRPARLADPGRYLDLHAGRLVILDEFQRMPELFRVLRGQIDERRRRGRRSGQFLLLGSASDALLRQSSESLAGRIVYEELPGLDALEVGSGRDSLWIRGGFLDAFTARSDAASERHLGRIGGRAPCRRGRRRQVAGQLRRSAAGGSANAPAVDNSAGFPGGTCLRQCGNRVTTLSLRSGERIRS